jgi:hypothetical protein
MTTKKYYKQLKADYQTLFWKCDNYLKTHPSAVVEYDEMCAEDPTLSFKHTGGIIGVHTTFVLHRVKVR